MNIFLDIENNLPWDMADANGRAPLDALTRYRVELELEQIDRPGIQLQADLERMDL